jgi:phosphohistidine swiveling domain-containing protein
MESNEAGIPHTSHSALIAGVLELQVPERVGPGANVAELADQGIVSVGGVPTTVHRVDGQVTVDWPDG